MPIARISQNHHYRHMVSKKSTSFSDVLKTLPYYRISFRNLRGILRSLRLCQPLIHLLQKMLAHQLIVYMYSSVSFVHFYHPLSNISKFIFDIKQCKGHSSRFRVRFGNFWLIYEVDDEEKLVFLLKLDVRSEIYPTR